LRESSLSRRAHAFHALLSLVPNQGEKAVETRSQYEAVLFLQVGYSRGILELLRMVPRTCAPRFVIVAAP
jgi:hypothetical protein